DKLVTGVQTCALPISWRIPRYARWSRDLRIGSRLATGPGSPACAAPPSITIRTTTTFWFQIFRLKAEATGLKRGAEATRPPQEQIGRASCRERVEGGG